MGLEVVLYEPEIPPNTGNVARTCVAVGARLHLIGPLGFSLDDRSVRRAGLDYWPRLSLRVHDSWEHFERRELTARERPLLLTTRGNRSYREIEPPAPRTRTLVVFGPETRGLPAALLAAYPDDRYRIPMVAGERSLNLGNAVAVVVYDLLARAGFPGMQ